MEIKVILPFIVFVGYILFLLITFKKPLSSISESWYKLQGLKKQLFTLFCCTLGFLIFLQTDGSTGWFFLSGIGLFLTGSAAMFKESYIGFFHSLGAYICIGSAFLALVVERSEWLPILAFLTAAILIRWLVKSYTTWWIEITAFIFIFLGLLS